MKKTLFYVALIGVALFAACSDGGDEAPSNYPEDNVIRVTTHLAATIVTRSGETETSTQDITEDFGLSVQPINGNSDFALTNIVFTNTDGTWAPADEAERHWQSRNTMYYCAAYAPARESLSAIWLGDEGDYEHGTWIDGFQYDLGNDNIDLLWTSQQGTAEHLTAKNGALDLTFEHMFSQFKLEVEIGNVLYNNNYDVSPLQYVTISNVGGSGIFDVVSGEFYDTQDAVIFLPFEEDAPSNVPATNTHDGKILTDEVCIFPGEQSIKVSLKINDTTYSYTHTSVVYEPGHSYTLKVKVGTSSVNGAGITVSDWVDATPTDGSQNLATF